MANRKVTTDTIEAALKKAHGMVYVAAKAIACDPKTIKSRMKQVPRLQDLVSDQAEYMNDHAEMKLYEAIERGDPWSIQFVLRTRGRSRGYGGSKLLPGPPEPVEMRVVRGLSYEDEESKQFKNRRPESCKDVNTRPLLPS
jgi:hypothetical protein